MTKRVRIENADTSNHALTVEIWEKYDDITKPDRLIAAQVLHDPTDLCEMNIWSDRYIVVRES